MKTSRRRLLRQAITYRAVGIWAMFAAWLCVLFGLAYLQTSAAKASAAAYAMMSGNASTFTSPAAVVFQFYDDVGLLTTQAIAIQLLCLMIGAFGARHRFSMMAVSVLIATAMGMGLLEKIVYARWTQSNESLLLAEYMQTVSRLDISDLFLRPSVLADLEGILLVNGCSIMGAAFWAIACRCMVRRRYSLHERTARA